MLTIFGFDEKVRKCPHCINAKRLAEAKGIAYEFISIVELVNSQPEFIQERLDELMKRMNRTSSTGATMPQIFLGDTHIGGFSDMAKYIRDNHV